MFVSLSRLLWAGVNEGRSDSNGAPSFSKAKGGGNCVEANPDKVGPGEGERLTTRVEPRKASALLNKGPN